VFARNEFREIPIDEALALVEAPLEAIGETLETPYDSTYVRRKDAVLGEARSKCCGFGSRPKM
jgi:hypothetical protein